MQSVRFFHPFGSRLAVALLSVLLGPAATRCAEPDAVKPEKYHLIASDKPGDLQRVKVVLDLRGELLLNADGKKVTRKPLEGTAELLYDERRLPDAENGARRYARYYQDAKARVRVGEFVHEPPLRDDRRLIVCEPDASGPALFSPWGPLTREELELIDVQGARLPLAELLPAQGVAIGESWSHDENTLAELLGLEVISRTDVKSTLRKVEKQVAMMEMSGSITGAVGGVLSEIELQAKYNFDLRQRRVTWLAAVIKEKRSIGHAEPGFEVTTRLRMAAAESDQSEQLSEPALADLSLDADAGAAVLRFEAANGRFRLLHDRRWRVLVDRHDVAILRLVDRGDLIAQCNVSRLDDLSAGRQLQLEAFQEEIRGALGDNFGQFVEASQTVTQRGLRVLRVVASGTVSQLPIQWTYHHVSNDEGQRASFVFTLQSKLVERFGDADDLLVSSLELLGEPTPVSTEAQDVEKTENAEKSARRLRSDLGKRLRR